MCIFQHCLVDFLVVAKYKKKVTNLFLYGIDSFKKIIYTSTRQASFNFRCIVLKLSVNWKSSFLDALNTMVGGVVLGLPPPPCPCCWAAIISTYRCFRTGVQFQGEKILLILLACINATKHLKSHAQFKFVSLFGFNFNCRRGGFGQD